MSAELWTIDEISSFLKKSRATVYARIINVPDFPKAIRIPSQNGKYLHPLWIADEVEKWAFKYQK